MDVKNIKRLVEESKKTKFSTDVERLKKILKKLEQQEKANVFYKIEYCKAE